MDDFFYAKKAITSYCIKLTLFTVSKDEWNIDHQECIAHTVCGMPKGIS